MRAESKGRRSCEGEACALNPYRLGDEEKARIKGGASSSFVENLTLTGYWLLLLVTRLWPYLSDVDLTLATCDCYW